MSDRPRQQNPACFLCSPDPQLVYAETDDAFVLCGLGPLVEGYSVLASRNHVRSAADRASVGADSFLRFVANTRERIIARFGNCLMTEHGRLPVCDYVSGRTESHCFHAHFLLFPGAPTVESEALPYFRKVTETVTLADALAEGRLHHEYFLLSPAPDRFLVMAEHEKLPRQFARLLVATALGVPDQADWKTFPRREIAVATAESLRLSLALPRAV